MFSYISASRTSRCNTWYWPYRINSMAIFKQVYPFPATKRYVNYRLCYYTAFGVFHFYRFY